MIASVASGANLRRNAWLMLVVLLFVSSGCGSKGSKGEASLERPARPVKTFVFGDAVRNEVRHYPGRVHADRSVQVSFGIPGRILELPVIKGQPVAKGDLLAGLDARDLENALASAEAVYQESRTTLARLEAVAASGAVSQQEVDLATARMRVARAEVSVRRKALEDARLVAPFDGTVADRFVQDFEQVVADQPVLSLHDGRFLEVRIEVPEADMVGVDPAALGRLSARFSALPGRSFALSLKEVVTSADPVTQTFPVTLRMPRPEDVEVLPGMTATVEWVPPARPGGPDRTVPAAAVLGAPGKTPWVFVLDPDAMTVSRREISVGSLVADARIEIESGLEPGERIASAGVHHLRDGQAVRLYRPEGGSRHESR